MRAINIKHLELETFRFAINRAIHERELQLAQYDLRVFADHIAKTMVYQMSVDLAAKREVITESKSVITCPNGLWNYFKQRFFPKWLLAKYPVQLSKFEYIHKTEIVRVCPHIQVPPDRTKFCIQYLEGNSFQ